MFWVLISSVFDLCILFTSYINDKTAKFECISSMKIITMMCMTVHLKHLTYLTSFQNACSCLEVDQEPIQFGRIMDTLSPFSDS